MSAPGNPAFPERSAPASTKGQLRLWGAVLLAPAAWALDLLARYGLGRLAFVRGTVGPLHVVSAITFATALLGVGLCLRFWWRLRPAPDGGGNAPPAEAKRESPAATLAIWGAVLGLYFALLIATQVVPALFLGPKDLI